MHIYALAAAGAAIIAGLVITRQQPTQQQPSTQPVPNSPLNITEKIKEVLNVNRYNNAAKLPLGVRNNNPLNIRKSGIAWQGKTGNDGSFEIFDTPFNGIRAAARNLKTYANSHGLRTIRSIIGRWAPAVENNVEAYVNSVVKRTGLFPDLILNTEDYVLVVEAMIYHENGQQPYELTLIRNAVYDGFA